MKNKYKNFMSNHKAIIKMYIGLLQYTSNKFILSDIDLLLCNDYQQRLNTYRKLFNSLFNKNLSLKQFINLFNMEV